MIRIEPYSSTSVLPPNCRGCLYWELPEQFRAHPAPDIAVRLKQGWIREHGDREAGGFVAYDYGEAVGFCQYAIAPHFPEISEYDCGPVSADGLFIACLHVEPASQRQGIGTMLRERVEEEAIQRGVPSVETFARVGDANNPSGPTDFWERAGYQCVRRVGEFALMQKDR